MQSKAATVAEYLGELPADRREALMAVREVILKNLDEKFEEGMTYGMIGYYVPHSVYPPGYHCDPKMPLPFAGLASQKNHMSVYLMCVYGESGPLQEFQESWAKTGKKLDMGKSCIRFKKVSDLALDVIAQTIKPITAEKWIAYYEKAFKKNEDRKAKATKTAAPKKKSAPKKAAKKSAVQKAKAKRG
jgi:hypothetical protein